VKKKENEFGVRGPTKREGLIASNQASNPNKSLPAKRW
jgi:hypothetical protein